MGFAEFAAGFGFRALAAMAVVPWVLACAGVPGTHPSYRVDSTQVIGPLLDVRMEWTSSLSVGSSDRRISLLFENAECAEWLVPGAIVEYQSGGQTGGVRMGEQRCEAVGISSLREWRDRKPRRYVTRPGDDRAQATYRIVFEQDDYAIVRGRFPLASLIAWYGGEDTLAIIPKQDDCSGALEKGVATMEFKDAGAVPLFIVGEQRCPIAGFARVVPGLSDS
jgi:hypothetical protein